ncbi:MAG: EAL domain-containing protein [Clostridiales bacterium]|nr:EAL domain-containing protein [Clostridiales bacterium]
MSSNSSNNKTSLLPFCIIGNYVLSAAITYLVCATGGAPSIYANLILIPIAIIALFTPVWHSVLFAALCGLAMGPLTTAITGGDMNNFAWVIRFIVYIVLGLVISAISNMIKQREQHFKILATQDPLTGIHNIRALEQAHIPSDCTMTILMMSFIDSSDMQGLFGNDFYQSIILRISKELQDLLSSYPNAKLYKGNDLNYAITVSHHTEEGSLESLLASLSNLNDVTITIDQVPVYVQYRIGFTIIQDGESITEGLRNANIALRYSFLKEQQISRYTEAMRDYYKGTVSIASEFSTALSKGMVQASYQTIHDAKTKEAHSVEIFAKWIREDGSKMTAEEFVPILEKTSCLHELTLFMTKEALRYARLPMNENHLFHINFAASELNEKSVQEFVHTVEDSGISPENVMLEIAGRLPEDPYMVRENLLFLHKHKIRIAIDYFHSGFSSYVMLADVPIDEIKLSRSLTSHIESERGYALVKSIVSFCKETNILTVAEGVENEHQANLCSQAGIDYLQGYYFSVPRLLSDVRETVDILSARSAAPSDEPIDIEELKGYSTISVVRKSTAAEEEESDAVSDSEESESESSTTDEEENENKKPDEESPVSE